MGGKGDRGRLSARDSISAAARAAATRAVLGLGVTALAFGAMTVVATPGALASPTAVTLFVDGNGQNTTGCTSAGQGACQTVQEGITAAEALTNSAVTLDVAGQGGPFGQQSYQEINGDTIQVPATDTLTIQGVDGPAVTSDGTGSVFTIRGSEGVTGTPRVTIDGLTIEHGGGTGTGGGVNDSGDLVVLSDDTIIDNSSIGSGGGVYNQSGNTLTLTNDTIANNTASFAGDAILTLLGETVLDDDTLFNNGSDGIDFSADGTASISNSILDETRCNPGTATLATIDGGHNVESDNSCDFGSTDVVNSSTINLATALAANGSNGPETYAIGTNSSAFEAVPSDSCTVQTDERGLIRPGVPEQNCDAGAFEFQGSPPVAPTVGDTSAPGVSSTTAILSASVTPGGADTTVTATCTGGPFLASSVDAGAATTAVTASVNLTDLAPQTQYTCSVTATNSVAGPVTSTNSVTFTTTATPVQPAPAVGPASDSAVGSTAATLGASVNPEGADTTVTATCTGGPFAASSVDAGAGTTAVAASVSLTGLTPGAAYSCAITATNSGGTTTSATNAAFTTSTAPSPPAAPPGTTSSMSATSTSSTGTASATNDGVTATGTGVGSLTVAEYSSSPVGEPHAFTPSGVYFDVSVAQGSSFTSLKIVDSNLNGARTLYWWNGSAWETVSPQTFSYGPPRTITATLSATSSPTIAQLTGTIFAVGTSRPPNTVLVKSKITGRKHIATFSFKAIGPASGFQCALVRTRPGRHGSTRRPTYSACKSPKTYMHLSAGRYTFYVRATGPGGTDPTPAHKPFKLA